MILFVELIDRFSRDLMPARGNKYIFALLDIAHIYSPIICRDELLNHLFERPYVAKKQKCICYMPQGSN